MQKIARWNKEVSSSKITTSRGTFFDVLHTFIVMKWYSKIYRASSLLTRFVSPPRLILDVTGIGLYRKIIV
jgi:hypothetical protein